MGKTSLLAAALPAALLLGAVPAFGGRNDSPPVHMERHQHFDQDQFSIDIAFLGFFGFTKTDNTGTCYNVLQPLQESYCDQSQVYSQALWGTWPLYFWSWPIHLIITVTSNRRNTAKVQVLFRAFDLKLNGTDGVQIYSSQTFNLAIDPGQTETLDQTIVINPVPGAGDGLDDLAVFVYRADQDNPGNGGDKDRDHPKLLAKSDGIFCPPKYTPPAP